MGISKTSSQSNSTLMLAGIDLQISVVAIHPKIQPCPVSVDFRFRFPATPISTFVGRGERFCPPEPAAAPSARFFVFPGRGGGGSMGARGVAGPRTSLLLARSRGAAFSVPLAPAGQSPPQYAPRYHPFHRIFIDPTRTEGWQNVGAAKWRGTLVQSHYSFKQ